MHSYLIPLLLRFYGSGYITGFKLAGWTILVALAGMTTLQYFALGAQISEIRQILIMYVFFCFCVIRI